ncbi:Protein of unknown function [Pyronema omphalodes CBS 100304]|uniref:Uncharacterized protein n=1 Tax=Pyronema omphalodes (strain CBS 100304) TaxID=1076935 RepID=U4LN49_PYROM|nr:Protein of unknown function [Pyronema omphalodes CBS 100304]
MKSPPPPSPSSLHKRRRAFQAKYFTSPTSPIAAIRFINQLDFYLYQAQGVESKVIEKLPAALHNDLQLAWFNKLKTSVSPRPLTLHDLRLALLSDFGVDPPTTRLLLSRYETGNLPYLRSQSFKVTMNYLDEIESLKTDVSSLRLQGEEERRELAEKWKRILHKTQSKQRVELEEEKKRREGLEREVQDLRLAVKGLTIMLGEQPEEQTNRRLEMAWEEFKDTVESAQKGFEKAVDKCVKDSKIPPNKRMKESYRRPETMLDGRLEGMESLRVEITHSESTTAVGSEQGPGSPAGHGSPRSSAGTSYVSCEGSPQKHHVALRQRVNNTPTRVRGKFRPLSVNHNRPKSRMGMVHMDVMDRQDTPALSVDD